MFVQKNPYSQENNINLRDSFILPPVKLPWYLRLIGCPPKNGNICPLFKREIYSGFSHKVQHNCV